MKSGTQYAQFQMVNKSTHDIVQPYIFYLGGMIRSNKLVRMAEKLGILCTPNILVICI